MPATMQLLLCCGQLWWVPHTCTLHPVSVSGVQVVGGNMPMSYRGR